jgi:hypothetical protein
VAWALRVPVYRTSSGRIANSTQILRNAMDAWTLVETMDNKMGRRFKKPRNAAPTPGPLNPLVPGSRPAGPAKVSYCANRL